MTNIPTRNKKLSYRRVTWTDKNNETLEDCLKKAHEQFTTTASRTFPGKGGSEVTGADYKHKKGIGLFLQIVSYVPDQPTSTITKASTEKICAIEEAHAPHGKDYLSGDIFVLINKNDIILCTSGAREQIAAAYFRDMLIKFGLEDAALTIKMKKVAKCDKIKMIQKEGVKAIQLGASLFDAGLEHINSGLDNESPKISDLGKVIATQLKKVFAKDPTLKEINEKENIKFPKPEFFGLPIDQCEFSI